jgi:hypothetical protein
MTAPRLFSKLDLDAALEAGIIDPATAQRLDGFLVARAPQAPPTAPMTAPARRFDLIHLLWYAGALIVMSAMGLFSTLAFTAMGGAGLTMTGLIYGIGLAIAGDRLWQKQETRTPGGLLIAAAISMVPLIVFGVQEATGNWAGFEAPGKYRDFFHYVKGGWLPMEIATLLASLASARRYAFAFIAFPAAICLWFLSMDIAEWIGSKDGFSFELRRNVSLWFGIGLFVATWIYELRPRKADFAFWLHLVAAVTFWGGLTFQSSGSEFGKLLYCLINIGLVGVALFTTRRIYAVFGVIGVMVYLGHLGYTVFKDSLLFPFALSAFGLAMVALGIYLAKRQAAITAWFERALPSGLAALRPFPARQS